MAEKENTLANIANTLKQKLNLLIIKIQQC